MLRILHLSDIHFGQEKRGELIRHDDVREQLIADLAGLLNKSKFLDLILINGDIGYSGKKTEYNHAVAWLDRLITVGGCDETAILTIPGNHDIDVNLISKAHKLVHTELRKTEPREIQNRLHEYATEPDEVNSIFPKLMNYLEFARGYNSDFDDRSIPRWIRYHEIRPGCRLRIIGLCSVQVSDLDDRQGEMILGEKQYIFPDDRSVITLVMVHHPMQWFLDQSTAKIYISNRSSILLTGHEHLAELNKITALNGLERIEISAGAITDTQTDAPFEFAYNLLELDLKNEDDMSLSVTVWPRIWCINLARFMPDTNKTGGPDFRTLSIECGIKPVPTGPSTIQNEDVQDKDIGMKRDDTTNFGRLKHFFWHYLTWDQRISVLVRAGVLPLSAGNPLPQTVELDALSKAREGGKLDAVWDDIMIYVPEEKRRANPFTREVT